MPNNITNELRFDCDTTKERERVTLALMDTMGNFDFNKVIKMPEALAGTTANFKGADTPEKVKLEEQYGHHNWYDWSIANWGTKWNAYDNHRLYEHQEPVWVDEKGMRRADGKPIVSREKTNETNAKLFKAAVKEHGVPEVLRFDTAWSTPNKVFERLSTMYPDKTFTIKYADEDLPHNSGEYALKNGMYQYWKAQQEGKTVADKANFKIDAFELKYQEPLEGKALDEEWEIIDATGATTLVQAEWGRTYVKQSDTFKRYLTRAYRIEASLSDKLPANQFDAAALAGAIDAYYVTMPYLREGNMDYPNIIIEDRPEVFEKIVRAMADVMHANLTFIEDMSKLDVSDIPYNDEQNHIVVIPKVDVTSEDATERLREVTTLVNKHHDLTQWQKRKNVLLVKADTEANAQFPVFCGVPPTKD